MFCFYGATQRKRGTLDSERNVEDAYNTKGFSSWKKQSQCFKEQQQTHCHKSAALYYVVIPKWKDAGEMTNSNLVNVHEKEKSVYLM